MANALLKSIFWKKHNQVVSTAAVSSVMPQAVTFDDSLQHYEKRHWRGHFSKKLAGRGLEIGPLHRPMVKHDRMKVDYIDRCTVSELRSHYPELNNLPLIEPDILGDAEDLAVVKDAHYDFLISAHVIEHMKNPLSALEHWCRVVKPGGLIYLIAPDKRAIFDYRRVRTTLAHIILDYKSPSDERDFEHYLDYAIHVHNQHADAAIREAKRLIETDYSIHYHVFLPADMKALLNWFSENIRKIEIVEGPVMSPQVDEFTEPSNFAKSVYPESDEFHFLLRVT